MRTRPSVVPRPKTAQIAILLLRAMAKPQRLVEWSIALLIAWAVVATILVLSPLILLSVQLFLNGVAAYLVRNGLANHIVL